MQRVELVVDFGGRRLEVGGVSDGGRNEFSVCLPNVVGGPVAVVTGDPRDVKALHRALGVVLSFFNVGGVSPVEG